MFAVTLRNYDSSIQNFEGEMTLYVIIASILLNSTIKNVLLANYPK